MSDDITPANPGDPAPSAGDPAPSDLAAGAIDQPDEGSGGGEPPKERWDDILANARTKAADEVRQEYEERYGWANGLNRTQVDRWRQISERMEDQLLRGDSRREPQGPPQPDLKTEDGRLLYSAERMAELLEYQREQLESAYDQRVSPMEQALMASQQNAEIDSTVQQARQLPHWTPEIEAAVEQAMDRSYRTNPDIPWQTRLPWAILSVMSDKLGTRDSFLKELNSKPGPQVRPGSEPARGKPDDAGKSMAEIMEEEAARLASRR